MNISIDIKNLATDLTGRVADVVTTVSLAYAKEVEGRLLKATPPPPKRGAQVYVSEKQRRFVMAMIGQGKIKVPYVRGRGSGLKGSETLNRSYRVDKEGLDAVLYSAASYAPYVVGDQQAPIHQKRWPTAMQVAADIGRDGTLDIITRYAIQKAGLE